MFPFRKKKQGGDVRAGFVQTEDETAFAVVRKRPGDRPLLEHCGVFPVTEIKPEHVFAALLDGPTLAKTRVSGVLGSDDYQVVQVESPEVPSAELRAAVRWKLRDLISFPVDEAVVDVFPAPASSRHARVKMLSVVAARSAAVQKLTATIAPRARRFDVIDIPELCLRNLCALLPQDEKGVALLALGEGFAQLVLTRKGVLYMTRRIETTPRFDIELNGTTPQPSIDAVALALELQRSLDYYESSFDQPPISDLVLTPTQANASQLAAALQNETSLKVEVLDIERLLQVADGVDADIRWSALIALGAALRTESVGA